MSEVAQAKSSLPDTCVGQKLKSVSLVPPYDQYRLVWRSGPETLRVDSVLSWLAEGSAVEVFCFCKAGLCRGTPSLLLRAASVGATRRPRFRAVACLPALGLDLLRSAVSD